MFAGLARYDDLLLHWINGHNCRALDVIFIPVSWAGEMGRIWVLVGLGMMIFGRGRPRVLGLILMATMLIADRVIEWPLRELVFRQRPYLSMKDIRHVGIAWSGNSFPSAHATSVVIATVLLGAEYRKLLAPLIVFALLTIYSRPYLGMHHPFDAIVGALVGLAVGLVSSRLTRDWGRNGRPAQPRARPDSQIEPS
jgi:undecaprenyl-diphosphatase